MAVWSESAPAVASDGRSARHRSSERFEMILRHLASLNNTSIVLASGSPRRKEILSNIGVVFNVVKSKFEEDLDKQNYDGAAAYAQATAWMKAKDVCENWDCSELGPVPDVIISADTVVESDSGEILEKPADKSEATRMLQALSNGKSKVHTGVALLAPKVPRQGGAIYGKSFSETTKVEFAELSLAEIEAYVATGDPFDKAGGYGIQGAAGVFIRGIVGDYFNVMGFPVHAFAREIESMVPPILEHA